MGWREGGWEAGWEAGWLALWCLFPLPFRAPAHTRLRSSAGQSVVKHAMRCCWLARRAVWCLGPACPRLCCSMHSYHPHASLGLRKSLTQLEHSCTRITRCWSWRHVGGLSARERREGRGAGGGGDGVGGGGSGWPMPRARGSQPLRATSCPAPAPRTPHPHPPSPFSNLSSRPPFSAVNVSAPTDRSSSGSPSLARSLSTPSASVCVIAL
eukprot:2448149-Rhodomonas_salina.2